MRDNVREAHAHGLMGYGRWPEQFDWLAGDLEDLLSAVDQLHDGASGADADGIHRLAEERFLEATRNVRALKEILLRERAAAFEAGQSARPPEVERPALKLVKPPRARRGRHGA